MEATLEVEKKGQRMGDVLWRNWRLGRVLVLLRMVLFLFGAWFFCFVFVGVCCVLCVDEGKE